MGYKIDSGPNLLVVFHSPVSRGRQMVDLLALLIGYNKA